MILIAICQYCTTVERAERYSAAWVEKRKPPQENFLKWKKGGWSHSDRTEIKSQSRGNSLYKTPFISTASQGNNHSYSLHPRHHSYPSAGHSAFASCTPALLCDGRNFTLIAKANGLFLVSCFYVRVKMSVLFDFYGTTGMAHQHRMPAEQMFPVSVKGGGVLCALYCLVFMTGS